MIAVVPRRLACKDDYLVIVDMPLEVPYFTKSMAWNRDPAHQWIRALCVEVSQDDPFRRYQNTGRLSVRYKITYFPDAG